MQNIPLACTQHRNQFMLYKINNLYHLMCISLACMHLDIITVPMDAQHGIVFCIIYMYCLLHQMQASSLSSSSLYMQVMSRQLNRLSLLGWSLCQCGCY